MSATDRTADGWRKSGDGATKKKSEPTTEKKKAGPTPAPIAKATPVKVAAVKKDPIPAATPDVRARAVANGRAILAGNAAKPKRQDCSGFVTAAFERAGRPLEIPHEFTKGTKSLAEMLYRTAKAQGRSHKETPRPGDLAFFRDTYGKIDGRITHVAMVESVADDGTVTLLHHMGGRYRRSPMNLRTPHEPLKNGFFRKRGSANEPVLAGELFVAYARPH